MSKGVFFCFFWLDEVGLGLGFTDGDGEGESLACLEPREKKVVIWLCFRTRGERPLLAGRRAGGIGTLKGKV